MRGSGAGAHGQTPTASSTASGSLRAPLTGVVIEVRVAVGDVVAQGDVLMVVEAMKMLNELRARVAGEVESVLVEVRDRVELGADLLVIRQVVTEEPEPQPPNL